MKKRILTSAIAIVAAMSLSAAAFAVDPGETNGAQTGEATVVADGETKIESEGGLEVSAPAGTFADTVEKVVMDANVTATDNTAAAATVTTLEAVVKELKVETTVTVNTKLEITLKDQDGKEIQPGKAVTVTIAYDGVSNIVAYVDGDKVEFFALKVAEDKKTASFETTHFSDYYLVQVADADVDKLVGKSGTAGASGNTDDNKEPDKNKPTGVVLAIVPAAVAAAAVVISKKRK